MLSGVMLLEHLGELEAANKLRSAIKKVIAEQKCVTADLAPMGEPVGTVQMTEAIAQAIH